MMPNVDGLELVKRIRASKQASYVYVIMLTAKAEKHDIVLGMGAGADDFLAKPFHRDELNVRLRAGKRIVDMSRALANTNRRMKRNLDAAAKIQQSYLPGASTEVEGFEFAWEYRPCHELGGDMLNIVPLDENNIAIYVLDVNGSGLPASLLATTISRFMAPAQDPSSILVERGADSLTVVEPKDVARKLNQQFSGSPETNQFFTIIYGIIDRRTSEFRYTCAGHPPLLHQPADGAPRIHEGFGLPIGVAPDNDDYHQETVKLTSGDRLFIYSNGILNTPAADGELFGSTRLIDSVSATKKLALKETLQKLVGEVGEFLGDETVNDDVAILAFEVE
jgi:sigma-B regulation protein RsbU (phosphoserine phosphatase)